MAAPSVGFDGMDINDGSIYTILPNADLGYVAPTASVYRSYTGAIAEANVSRSDPVQMSIQMVVTGSSVANLSANIAALNTIIASCSAESPKALVYDGVTYSIITSPEIPPQPTQSSANLKFFSTIDLVLNRLPATSGAPGGGGGGGYSPSAGTSFVVTAYGATGNGLTDDAAAIQATFDAAAAANALVYFPPGDYLVGSTLLITAGITVQGSGPGSRLLLADGASATTDLIRVHGYVEGLVIEGLALEPETTGDGRHGIHLDCTSTVDGDNICSHFVIAHNVIGQWNKHFGGRGIATTFNQTNGIFNGVIRENKVDGGIYLDKAGDTIAVRDNILTGAGPGLYADLVLGAGLLEVQHNTFVGDSGTCIELKYGLRVRIIDNVFEPAVGATPGTNGALLDCIGYADPNNIRALTVRDNSFQGTPDVCTSHIRLDYVTAATIDNNLHVYGDAGQKALKTTANPVDVTVRQLRTDPWLAAVADNFDLTASVAVDIPRAGWHRLGPVVQVIDDQGIGYAREIIHQAAGQTEKPLVIEDSDSTELFAVDQYGGVTVGARVTMVGGLQVIAYNGDPEGAISAPVGSLYLRSDNSGGQGLYFKKSGGSGNTGWVAVTTA